jgi:Zn-dependent peptidase ImmA (M78 family)
MASLYGRALDFFFQSNLQPDPLPLWRKTANTEVKKTERAFLSFLEHYSKLERLLNLNTRWKDIQTNYNKSDFGVQGFGLVNRLAEKIRDSLDLGSRPATNLLNILENVLRFKILHLDLEEGISAASIVDEKLGVGILINANEVPWRRNFDLAHELFHIITWNVFSREEVGDGSVRTKPEQYADSFAASLLLPRSQLVESLEEITSNGEIRFVDIIELAKEFGVSTEAILWRLVNIKALKKNEVEEALRNPELRKIDKAKRRGTFYSDKPSEFPDRYIFLACKCVTEGTLSRGSFAYYMGIHRAEMDEYLKEHGFIEKTYEKITSS